MKEDIIGDGPESSIVRKRMVDNSWVHWHGAIIDESLIAPIIASAHLVFVPGLSG